MKSLFVLSFLIIPIVLVSQEISKPREIYFQTSGLYLLNSGLEYKIGLSEKYYLRATVNNVNAYFNSRNSSSTTAYPYTQNGGSINTSIGVEKRKSISERLKLISGVNILFGAGYYESVWNDPNFSPSEQKSYSINFNPGISLHGGVLIYVSDHITIGATYEPRVYYNISKSVSPIPGGGKSTTTYTGLSAGLSPDMLRLLVGFRWSKLKD